jgi:hypothetical protein
MAGQGLQCVFHPCLECAFWGGGSCGLCLSIVVSSQDLSVAALQRTCSATARKLLISLNALNRLAQHWLGGQCVCAPPACEDTPGNFQQAMEVAWWDYSERILRTQNKWQHARGSMTVTPVGRHHQHAMMACGVFGTQGASLASSMTSLQLAFGIGIWSQFKSITHKDCPQLSKVLRRRSGLWAAGAMQALSAVVLTLHTF